MGKSCSGSSFATGVVSSKSQVIAFSSCPFKDALDLGLSLATFLRLELVIAFLFSVVLFGDKTFTGGLATLATEEVVRGAHLAFARTSRSQRRSWSSEAEKLGKAASLGFLDLADDSGRDPSEVIRVFPSRQLAAMMSLAFDSPPSLAHLPPPRVPSPYWTPLPSSVYRAPPSPFKLMTRPNEFGIPGVGGSSSELAIGMSGSCSSDRSGRRVEKQGFAIGVGGLEQQKFAGRVSGGFSDGRSGQRFRFCWASRFSFALVGEQQGVTACRRRRGWSSQQGLNRASFGAPNSDYGYQCAAGNDGVH